MIKRLEKMRLSALKLLSLHKVALGIIVIILFVVLSRVFGGLLAPRETLYNSDELEMTLSAIDRYLGLPSTSLAWPGSTLQILAVPTIALDFVLDTDASLSLSGFATYISKAYREPWDLIFTLRIAIVLLSSVGFALLYIPILELTKDHIISFMSVVLLATIPAVWLHSHMVVGDALSLAFTGIALALLTLVNWPLKRVALAGGFMGLAIASKITILFAFPVVLGFVLQVQRRRSRHLILFCLFTVLGFLLACPYIWVDPLRLAKSILGNAARSGTALGFSGALEALSSTLTLPVLLGFLLGVLLSLWTRPLLSGVSFLTFISLLAVYSRAGVVYPRYFLPFVIPAVIFAAIALQKSLKLISARSLILQRTVLRTLLTVSLATLLIISNVQSYTSTIQQTQAYQRELRALQAAVQELPEGVIVLIPFELRNVFAEIATNDWRLKLVNWC